MSDTGQWKSFTLDLGPIEPAASAIKDITSAIGMALTIQKTAVDILATLALDLLNVEALLIKAALETVQGILNQYLISDAKIHVLVIPPRRQLPYKLTSDFMMPQEEDSWAINETISDETKARFQKMLQQVAEHDQGNPGFARTVVESLYDEFDPNRPTYDKNSAVFATVILAGAQSMLGLYDFLATLQSLFGTALKGAPLIPATLTRTPQGLRAQAIAAPESSRIGVRLSWENPPARQSLPEYGGAQVIIKELAIIRSTDEELVKATTWKNIFGEYQPVALTEDEIEHADIKTTDDEQTTLIRVFKFDGVRTAYVDDEATLRKNTDYFYTLAYRYALADAPEGTTNNIAYADQTFHQLSNVAKVRVENEKVPSTHLSVQPNWMTHPSFLNLIPDLKFFMALLENYIESLKSQLTGSASALKSYVEFLKAEIDRYNAFATEINNRISKLTALFQLPATGIYMTTIAADSGGNDYFMQELVKRLMDETDPTAPPFFRNGLVGGIIIFAGAPNPAALTATQTLVSLLLGLNTTFVTPFQEAVDSIDHVITTLETQTFGSNMQPGNPPEHTDAHQTFDAAMNPVKPTDEDADIPGA